MSSNGFGFRNKRALYFSNRPSVWEVSKQFEKEKVAKPRQNCVNCLIYQEFGGLPCSTDLPGVS